MMTENEKRILTFLFEKIIDETMVFDDGTVLMATVEVPEIKRNFPDLSEEAMDQTLDLMASNGLFADLEAHQWIDARRTRVKLSLYALSLYGTDF